VPLSTTTYDSTFDILLTGLFGELGLSGWKSTAALFLDFVWSHNKRTTTSLHVGVGSSSEPFASQADNVESSRQLVEEARM